MVATADSDDRYNAAVNPSRQPAEGGRDDIDGTPDDADNLAVNPCRQPAEGGRDDIDEAPIPEA
jgi:hypothetical protein